MRLLVGGECIDQPIDGGRGAVGVQRRHDQNAHFSRGNRNAHGFQVAKLAHQNHVRILSQGGVQGGREGGGMHADLALADEAVLAYVHKLDRILDGEDVAFLARIDVIDHGSERGGFAGSCLAGHQNQAAVDLA